jgi:hypothetical protein
MVHPISRRLTDLFTPKKDVTHSAAGRTKEEREEEEEDPLVAARGFHFRLRKVLVVD